MTDSRWRLDDESPKRVKEIRRFRSYKEFQELAKLLKEGDKVKIMNHVYELLDGKCAYGSGSNGWAAGQALRLVLIEEGFHDED